MKDYEINEDTLAIIPINENSSKVLEREYEYIVDKSTYTILDDSCQYFGSTYEGRKGGSKNILGSGYKVPILIKEENYIIFFPTESPLLDSCVWLSLHHIEKLEKGKNNSTEIFFKDGKKININISFRSIENQILRSTKLESILRYRSLNRNNKNLLK